MVDPEYLPPYRITLTDNHLPIVFVYNGRRYVMKSTSMGGLLINKLDSEPKTVEATIIARSKETGK